MNKWITFDCYDLEQDKKEYELFTKNYGKALALHWIYDMFFKEFKWFRKDYPTRDDWFRAMGWIK